MCWKSLMHLIQLKCDKYPLRLASVHYNLFSDSAFLCRDPIGCWVAVSAECWLIKVIKRSSGAKSLSLWACCQCRCPVSTMSSVHSVQTQRWPVQCTTFKLDHNWDRLKQGKVQILTIEHGRKKSLICEMELLLWTMEDRWWSLDNRGVTTNINGKCNFWQHYYSVFLWSLSMP